MSSRTTGAALARRRDLAVELWRLGHSTSEICAALGVCKSTIAFDLRSRGLVRVNRPRGIGPVTDSRLVPDLTGHRSGGATYQRSSTLALWSATLANCHHDNAVNRLANDVRDAVLAGDSAWLSQARLVLDEAAAYLHRLRAVVESEGARERAIHDPAERDDAAALFVVRADG